jgi:hypothetical protein
MLIRYGASWTAKWAGCDMEVVAADWANELCGLPGSAIQYGVVNLPLDTPPNSAQFKAICLRAPNVLPPLLPAGKADPERVRAIVDSVRKKIKRRDPRQWAYDLQSREASGERLNLRQKMCWREALSTKLENSMQSECKK